MMKESETMSFIDENKIIEPVYTYIDETSGDDSLDRNQIQREGKLNKETCLDKTTVSDFQTIENKEEDTVNKAVTSVGGIVWVDKNRNGILEDGEHGYPNVLINLYSYPDNKLIYTAITDENGRYVVKDIIPGDYRVIFSNIPNKYSFITANGYVTDTGVCPRILNIVSGKEYTTCNAPIALTVFLMNSETAGEYLNVSFVERQIVTVHRSVNLGHRTSRNHKITANAADLRVASNETYLVNYSANVKFAQEFNNDDYVALQFMINGMYIAEGFSYTKNQGLINGTCLINAVNRKIEDNESIINLVNVSTKVVRMDNLSITIVKVS